MSKSVRAALSLVVFCVSTASTFLLLSRCGSGDGSGDEAGFAYEYTGSYETPEAAAAALAGKTVAFTLRWNEAASNVEGDYTDDYFAKSPAKVSGSVADGVRTMFISLPAAVDGVVAFTITTDQASGELDETINIASLKAQGPGSVTVFEKSGIKISALKVTPASPQSPAGPGPEGDAGKFFAEVANEYDYFANNSSGNGDGKTWTHGKKYKVVVRSDGTVTLPTDGAPLEMKFDPAAGNKYEKYDHEDYAGLSADGGGKVLVQRVATTGEFFVTHDIAPVFWRFQKEDPGSLPSKWETLGLKFVTGTHKHKITSLSPANDTEHALGEQVEVVVGADGNVTGSFGEYKYDEIAANPMQGTSGGVPVATVHYYRPSSTEYPRYALEIHFENDKFSKITVQYQTKANSSDGSKGWVADTKK